MAAFEIGKWFCLQLAVRRKPTGKFLVV